MQSVERVLDITPKLLREYLLWLESSGHNPGGIHCYFRVVRTFLIWYENENELEGWSNPIHKLKAPKLPQEPLEPADLDDIIRMLQACRPFGKFHNDRDYAIILALLDTGCRANELLSINLDEIDLITGAVLIRSGKGRKSRTVYVGAKSRKAIRRYLTHKRQAGKSEALFCSDEGTRLSYDGLRLIIAKRASRAGVKRPQLHGFRRAFALMMLRAGCDIFTLQRLMGHSSLAMLNRYLAVMDTDTRKAHMNAGIVDKL